jgi:hypothetical protein
MRILSTKRSIEAMMQKVHKCALVGGVALFIWSVIFWMVFACKANVISGFQDEGDVTSTIADNVPKSGLYMAPFMSKTKDPEKMHKMEEKMAKGPYVFAAVKLEGRNPHMGMSMLSSLILKLFVAYVVAWLVLALKIAEPRKIVKFVALVGVVATCMAAFPPAIWFGFPASFIVCTLLEGLIGWVIAGFAIAKVAK